MENKFWQLAGERSPVWIYRIRTNSFLKVRYTTFVVETRNNVVYERQLMKIAWSGTSKRTTKGRRIENVSISIGQNWQVDKSIVEWIL